MREVFVRSAFNYDGDAVSLATGLACDPADSMVQQQFAEECDINTIVRRFGLTGELPQNLRMPVSGDFTQVGDFHSAMNLVRQAEEGFMELPGELRARFHHDPGELLSFLDDPANRDEAVKLGLVQKPAEVSRDGVPLPGQAVAPVAPAGGLPGGS